MSLIGVERFISNLFSIFLKNFLGAFVAFCPPCAGCVEFINHDENPVLGCCLGVTLMALVAQYRARNKIKVSIERTSSQYSSLYIPHGLVVLPFQGSLWCDFLMAGCCYQCLMCRLHRDANS